MQIPRSTIVGSYFKNIFCFVQNCWIIFKVFLFAFPQQWMRVPPAMNESCSTSLPVFGVASVLDFYYSNRCAAWLLNPNFNSPCLSNVFALFSSRSSLPLSSLCPTGLSIGSAFAQASSHMNVCPLLLGQKHPVPFFVASFQLHQTLLPSSCYEFSQGYSPQSKRALRDTDGWIHPRRFGCYWVGCKDFKKSYRWF